MKLHEVITSKFFGPPANDPLQKPAKEFYNYTLNAAQKKFAEDWLQAQHLWTVESGSYLPIYLNRKEILADPKYPK